MMDNFPWDSPVDPGFPPFEVPDSYYEWHPIDSPEDYYPPDWDEPVPDYAEPGADEAEGGFPPPATEFVPEEEDVYPPDWDDPFPPPMMQPDWPDWSEEEREVEPMDPDSFAPFTNTGDLIPAEPEPNPNPPTPPTPGAVVPAFLKKNLEKALLAALMEDTLGDALRAFTDTLGSGKHSSVIVPRALLEHSLTRLLEDTLSAKERFHIANELSRFVLFGNREEGTE